jgi:Predicted Zn peptidase
MNQVELARRLRHAREGCGRSQQEAADAINVPRTAITQMEAGNRSVSTLELTKLAALYQRPVTYFLREHRQEEEEDLLVALHRVAPGLDNDPKIKRQVDHCVAICRAGANLEQVLRREPRIGPPTFLVSVPRYPGDAVAQGEKVAEQERRRLGLGNGPLREIGELITSQGIWASGTDLPNEISGLFLRHPSIGLAILVNADHPKARKRFSYAHEYAHALLDRDRTVTISRTDNASELVEKRANAFAAVFLMPAEGIAEVLHGLDKGQPIRREQAVYDAATGAKFEAQVRTQPRSQTITYQDAAIIAYHFGVSYQAAVYRLRSLNYLSHADCSGLLAQEQTGKNYLQFLDLFKELESPEEKELWDREIRGQVVHMAIEAYRREEISRGKLLELSKLLLIDGSTLLELAEAARTE